jgi:rhomboid protease GluP
MTHDAPDMPTAPIDDEAPPLVIGAEMLAPPEAVERRVNFESGMSVLPWLCLALIAANVAVFAWEVATGALASEAAITAAGALHRESVLHGQVWRMPWSMFLHGDFSHILGNCIILYILGMGVEHAVGVVSTAGVYLFAGLCGASLSLLMQPGPAVGASGAIFGLAGALVVFLYRFRHVYYVRDKQIGLVLLAWAVFQIVTGFLDPRIDNFAHLGGFAGGALAALTLRPRVTPPTVGFAVQPNG